MGTPLVSIIIPSFNRESLIVETLCSVVAQIYQNWECIVVDDGSTDGTVNVIKDFCRRDTRIKYFSRNHQPKGAPTCRNIGVKEANGEYLIFLDSDDLLGSWCLEERINFIKKDKKIDFVVFNGIAFKNKPGDSKKIWNPNDHSDDFLSFLEGSNPWQTSFPIFRKDFLTKSDSWDQDAKSSQEWSFFIKLLKKKPNYLKLDVLPDCFIRQHEGPERIASNYFKPQYCLDRLDSYKRIAKILNTGKERKVFVKRLFNETRMLYIFGIDINPFSYFANAKEIQPINYYIFNTILFALIYLGRFLHIIKLTKKNTIIKRSIPKRMFLYSFELKPDQYQDLLKKLERIPNKQL